MREELLVAEVSENIIPGSRRGAYTHVAARGTKSNQSLGVQLHDIDFPPRWFPLL